MAALHPETSVATTIGLWPLTGYFAKLGTIGFGGPAALVGFMHRDLVEKRRWITEDTYKLSLALAQIMPPGHWRRKLRLPSVISKAVFSAQLLSV